MKATALGAVVAFAFARAAAAQPVANCSIRNDPQGQQWTLERTVTGVPDASWRVIFKSRALDRPQTELRVPNAEPAMTADSVTLRFSSANGGLNIDWRATTGASTIDIYVNFGLEVNVDADLDPAVEAMNTQGPVAVVCTLSPQESGTPSTPSTPSTASTLGTPGTLGTLGTFVPPGTLLRSEWVIGAGAAWGIRIFHSTGDRWYAIQTVSWGRELTSDLGPGVLRGRFVWAVEAMPVFAQTHPTDAYGVGIAPVLWRWNFVPRPRWSAFGELAMGGLWTSSPVPEQTRRANFTAHWGGGVRLTVSGERSVVLAYRLQHISNGNQLLTNPGVNSHVLFVGYPARRRLFS